MPAKSIAAVAALLALAVSSLFATAPVPRKAPELKFLDPSGKEILLSSFGGKVVIIEFMLVKCPHCLRVAQMINKLNGELGPRGFQPVGIVFKGSGFYATDSRKSSAASSASTSTSDSGGEKKAEPPPPKADAKGTPTGGELARP